MPKKPLKPPAPARRIPIPRRRPPLAAEGKPQVISLGKISTTHYALPEPGHTIYALIGQISMEWALVEDILDSCLTALAAHEHVPITHCFTSQMMGHSPRCLSIKALAHWRGFPEIEEAAQSLMNALYDASERRNRAIHDVIYLEHKNKAPYKSHRMSKKESYYGLKEFDVSYYEETIGMIRRRRADCQNLLNLIRSSAYEGDPWQKKPE